MNPQYFLGAMDHEKDLYISQTSEKGRGVFACRSFKEGEPIEVCPVLVLGENDVALIRKTLLKHYYYEWGDTCSRGAIVLGYGSIYNHSWNPNALYTFDEKKKVIVYWAVKDIACDEEIVVNYNGEPEDDDKPEFMVCA